MTRRGISDKGKAMLAEVAPPTPPVPASARLGPTPEQMRGGLFVRESAGTAHGQVNAVAYRRQPLFETLAKGKNSGISLDGLAALRFYRNRHEEAAQSLTRCALDIEARGGGLPLCLPPGVFADEALRHCEAAMGVIADTMRAVALDDQNYSDVAKARFGSREVSRIDIGTGRDAPRHYTTIEPKSGRHREIIREEFLRGLGRLIGAVTTLTSTARPGAPAEGRDGTHEPPSPSAFTPYPPAVDPRFLDERGMMRPATEIAEILRGRGDTG